MLRPLTEAVATKTPTRRLMFNFLGTISEYFLDLNRERTIEGMRAAAARGSKDGWRRKLSKEDLAMARALLKDTTIPVAQIARRLNVSRATFYAYFPRGKGRELGMSDRQIAGALGISEKTVRNHTSNIYRKLHIFDRTQAVIYAIREGVIDVEELEYRPPRER